MASALLRLAGGAHVQSDQELERWIRDPADLKPMDADPTRGNLYGRGMPKRRLNDYAPPNRGGRFSRNDTTPSRASSWSATAVMPPAPPRLT